MSEPETPEQTLRSRFPEIPWGEPTLIQVVGQAEGRWVCRYCIAREGVAGAEIAAGTVPFAFATREQATEHIREAHP